MSTEILSLVKHLHAVESDLICTKNQIEAISAVLAGVAEPVHILHTDAADLLLLDPSALLERVIHGYEIHGISTLQLSHDEFSLFAPLDCYWYGDVHSIVEAI